MLQDSHYPTNYFIIPGLGNSGPDHWQSNFERSAPNFRRIIQEEWDAPLCSDWITTINSTISGYDPATVVLIGHSLVCAAIAHWATQCPTSIKGAMLVAPSDLEAPQYTFPAKGFDPLPKTRLPFPSIVVTSNDDYWVSPERASFFARNWGSELINIGNAGHINAASVYGVWKEGLEVLGRLGA